MRILLRLRPLRPLILVPFIIKKPVYAEQPRVIKPIEIEWPKPKINTLALIWKYLKPDSLLLLCIVSITSLNSMVNVYTPLAIGKLISIVQMALKNGDSLPLFDPALKLLLLFASNGLLTFIDIALVSKLGENISLRIRNDLFASIIDKEMSFFDQRMQGEIIGRLGQDVQEFKHTFKLVVTQGLKCTSQIVGSLISLVTISPSLTFTLGTSMPVLYLFMNYYGIYLRSLSKKARILDANANTVASETISNIRTVRAFVGEEMELEKYNSASKESASLNTRLGFHIGLFQGLTNTSIGSMILLILYKGGLLVTKGDLTGGDLMAYMVSTQNTQRSLALVGVLFGQVIKALQSANRIFEYMTITPPKSGSHQFDIKGEIEFQNVSFTYPSRKDKILNKFDLVIPVGSVVALCGQSGSGKSTVGQLIEGFYDIDGGKILIDGVDIKDIDIKWLRKHVGYINQEPTLFATSILENIRYGNPDATLDQIHQAAREANADSFIQSFPDKYNTIVGERGATLSGGQKQRIAIARALLKNPQVLILDEATSALDNSSERLVQQALDKLMKGRTVLVIAHRLSTIQNADLIVVMQGKELKNGNILETGSHKELLKRKGHYWKLYQQMHE